MPRIFISTCLLDLDLFPWDQQVCFLQFGSWSLNGNQLDIFNVSTGADLSNYYPSGEWDLLGANVTKDVTYYNCCPEPYPSLVYALAIQRKQIYYILNFIFPMGSIMITSVLIFVVPPESGEKVSMSVTLLLSSTVFLLVVEDMLPVQSDNVPELSKSTTFNYQIILITGVGMPL